MINPLKIATSGYMRRSTNAAFVIAVAGYLFAPIDTPIVAGHGSFALTGQAVSGSHARTVPVGSATYLLTGQAVSGLQTRTLPVGGATYTLTGQDITWLQNRRVTVDFGLYALTGQDVGGSHKRIVPVGHGTYAITGQSVALDLDSVPVPGPDIEVQEVDLDSYVRLVLARTSVVTNALEFVSAVTMHRDIEVSSEIQTVLADRSKISLQIQITSPIKELPLEIEIR